MLRIIIHSAILCEISIQIGQFLTFLSDARKQKGVFF